MEPRNIYKKRYVSIYRYDCKEGYIDRMVCDTFYTPSKISNREYPSGYTSIYYRANSEGDWLSSDMVPKLIGLLNFSDEFTATKIFNKAKHLKYDF